MRRVPEVTYVDEPDEDADDCDHLGEHLTKIVELALQRCLFANLRRDGFVDVANSGLLASEDNDGRTFPIYYSGALHGVFGT